MISAAIGPYNTWDCPVCNEQISFHREDIDVKVDFPVQRYLNLHGWKLAIPFRAFCPKCKKDGEKAYKFKDLLE